MSPRKATPKAKARRGPAVSQRASGGRSRRAGRATKSDGSTEAPRATDAIPSFPRLPAAAVLAPLLSLSRDVSFEMSERELLGMLHRTLGELLPGRKCALRSFEPRSMRVAEVFASEGLLEESRTMPPTLSRAAQARTRLRSDLVTSGRVRISDDHPRLFGNVTDGFAVPLVAAGELLAVAHVEYPAPRPAAGLPIADDKAIVIPLANLFAVAVVMRRLLHETAYLQDYLGQLIDQANVLMVAIDREGRITIWNRALATLCGIPREEAVGREALPWLTSLGAPDVALLLNQVAASGQPESQEVKLPAASGPVRKAVLNVALIRGAEAGFSAVFAIGQDVTALRSLQSQVIHAEKLATVGQIAAGVAHEINNPLTLIAASAESLLRKGQQPGGALSEQDATRLRHIIDGTDRIGRLVRDLLSYARPSSGEIDVISINDVAEQAVSFCEHILDRARAKLEMDMQPGVPPIYGHADQILQVVINLLTNAADAVSERGGQLRLRTWLDEQGLVNLAVSDNGVGIREQDRPHVFEPFFTSKAAGRGTGLGLSIVRNIVFAHGGRVTFHARQGGGTTFIVTLPRRHAKGPDQG